MTAVTQYYARRQLVARSVFAGMLLLSMACPAQTTNPVPVRESLVFPVAPVRQTESPTTTPPSAENSLGRAQLTPVPAKPNAAPLTPALIESLTDRPTGRPVSGVARDVDMFGAGRTALAPRKTATVAATPTMKPTVSAPTAVATVTALPTAAAMAVTRGLDASQPVRANEFMADSRRFDFGKLQTTVSVQPGITEIVPIARGMLNRVVTSFEGVRARHALGKDSGASITASGSVIYVGTNTDAPINAFLIDTEDESRAMSVVFVPQDMPPREVFLNYAKSTAQNAGLPASTTPTLDAKAAVAWEESQPYVESIKSLMRTLALAELPPGYNLVDIANAVSVPRCTGSGLRTELGQVLEGGHYTVAIHRAENISGQTVNLNEQGCYQFGVLAVASWPRVLLEPGQDTEIYVVLRRDRVEAKRTARPVLVRDVRE